MKQVTHNGKKKKSKPKSKAITSFVGDIPQQPIASTPIQVLESSKIEANDYVRLYDIESHTVGIASNPTTITAQIDFQGDFYIKYLRFVTTHGTATSYKAGSFLKIYLKDVLIWQKDWVAGNDLTVDFEFTELFETLYLVKDLSIDNLKFVLYDNWDGANTTATVSIEIRGYYYKRPN